MITGSCLCGQIRYEIRGEMGPIIHCHCPTCRKAHASAFSSVATVQLADLTFTAGEALLKNYESSPGKRRYFCSNCGSQIYARREDQQHYIFRMGTVDGDPGTRPARHIFTRYKAPWYNIGEDLPEHLEWPPQAEPDPGAAAPDEYRQLHLLMHETLNLAARKGAATSLLLLNVDLSKEQSELAQLLRVIHHQIRLNVRDSDMIEPLAESRFAVLLPYTDAKASMILAERIRNTVKGVMHGAIASIGAATVKSEHLNSDELTLAVDQIIRMAEKACDSSSHQGGDKATHYNVQGK
ncbi:MAG: hypothetical protein COW18_01395 [Zetaproteobacteria bacterium CG12_big_fil_rev_8_21_14_0_65_54_13]|nr:MAG: hypothetical protein COX55_00985 [Zetaproteobacteria bacterium CG23_combo_of_CG06-09_8_20_14_all_54_7]PIW51395.1 MAG: hypothetical protein COW18_01395 [Zetaproteobacteria bacterium CG12_big_fil_rev_8_21_14_0_65_54_13]PIX54901.1 MAG: hypothetical protein COZ50_05760 [Zetaproteobacteria bacterium CG_4_10_14_3_um_filter_54_28]PJA30368.1 MAG: hypothetical protein CO188_04035 [Zetaproteobacteria bacterium CG_4_9_14_3_um_filter_54_145]